MVQRAISTLHKQSSMKEPHKISKVFSLAIFTAALVYVVIGAAGYIYFGENTKAAITDNLDDIPEIPEGAPYRKIF